MAKNANDVVITHYARTAIDRFGGVLKDMSSIDLAQVVLEELIQRSGLKKEQVEEIIFSTCILTEQGLATDIPGRQALLKAGFPSSTLSNHVDKACCSATSALQLAWKSLLLGEVECSMVVGMDNMGRQPVFLEGKYRYEPCGMGDKLFWDPVAGLAYKGFGLVSVDAGEVATQHEISREMQDEWAAGSHAKWAKAFERGFFSEEIFPVEVVTKKGKPPVIFDKDQSPRPETTYESLSKLPLIQGSKTVTAGNAPGINTGGSGVVTMTRKKAEELGLKPIAKVVNVVSIAGPYQNIASIPAPAIQTACNKAGISIDDIDLIEINEAFAAMPLVSTKILAGGDEARLKRLREITNVNGGAVAIGHPAGATGTRLVMTLIRGLRERNGRYGAAAICGGLGQGDAVIVEAEY